MNHYTPEGIRMQEIENHTLLSSYEGLGRAMEKGIILEAVALLCDGELTLHFDFCGIPALMKKEEVQYCRRGEAIKDIAVLTRVGKPVCFKVVGFSKNEEGKTVAVLSRRAAQIECYDQYISTLEAGDIIPSRITHMENFGAFVDIGCGIVSLLSIDCISVSRISHPSDRFSVGDKIYTVVKSVDEEGKIYVTHRELLGTWEENAAGFSPGQTVTGIVRSVESYGIFVELAPNLAGLAEVKSEVYEGDTAAVYIKSILPDKMKIKLIVIDTGSEKKDKGFTYYVDPEKTAHLSHWIYSPPGCKKEIRTDFSEA